MRRILQKLLRWAFRKTQAKEDQSQTIRALSSELRDARARESEYRQDYIERATELIEARQMTGSGPWLVAEARGEVNKPGKLREANPITSTGAFGDIALALENIEWRREVNLSWLEFSRWGIQQIILISRLYYIKNPLIRRLIDIAAYYVFGRGVEISSPDEAANEVLKEFFERNKSTLGQIALVELEKRKYYDGNLFFCLFADTKDKGLTDVRTIDATEIQDIVTNPNDSDSPWFYRRNWTQRVFNEATGATATKDMQAWYPALGYEPDVQVSQINNLPVMWGSPVLHRRSGAVAKWHFGCPIIYPALEWAKAARKFLESCLNVRKALSQIAMTITTKGGQQAMAGIKNQMSTTVGPTNSLWDTNPPAIDGSTFVSGPGTTLAAFNTKGAGGNPDEVRQFELMCCMVVGVPETFLGNVTTGNLATATSLDRPTELGFIEKQEAWVEDLTTIAKFVLNVSKGAASGKLREAFEARNMSAADIQHVTIRECARVISKDGKRMIPVKEAAKPGEIIVKVSFPSILEGDVPALVKATVEAMTLDNKGGQIIGIDAKAGTEKLYEHLDIENGQELAEQQYPKATYDPDRTKEPVVSSTPEPVAPNV